MFANINLSLTFDEIFYSALAALVLTWVIRTAIKVRRFMKSPTVNFGYQSKDFRQVLQKCYTLFPKEMFQFRGETYKRGMKLKITTLQNKSFEGEFIGCNEKDVLCILTKKYIIAHELTNVEEIQVIERLY